MIKHALKPGNLSVKCQEIILAKYIKDLTLNLMSMDKVIITLISLQWLNNLKPKIW